MAQFGRPSVDTLNDNWQRDDGTTVNIYQQVDETIADDNDYVRTVLAPTSDVFVTKLTTVEDPQVSTGHIVRYRYRKDSAAGAQIDLTVQLRQGYVNEGTPGTLIATMGTHTNISDVMTQNAYTLTGAEADSITDYSSLFIRFVGNQI